jgi:hypothetical protein
MRQVASYLIWKDLCTTRSAYQITINTSTHHKHITMLDIVIKRYIDNFLDVWLNFFRELIVNGYSIDGNEINL